MQDKKLNWTAVILGLVLIAAVGFAFRGGLFSPEVREGEGERLRVLATFFPIYDFVW